MSTNDVPGHNPANNDVLAMGCWAEHEDGSLILVESLEGDRVVFEAFDVSKDPPVAYRDAMAEADFKTAFSWPNDDDEQWVWHDKTPFPWERVMKDFPAGAGYASAGALLTAAERVAQSRQTRGRPVDPSIMDVIMQAEGIVGKLQAAIGRLRT